MPQPRQPGVYLFHLLSPLAHSTAQHYLGSAAHLPARVAQHLRGRGSKFTRAAIAQRIPFVVVRLWPTATLSEARQLERDLKRRHQASQYCPVCDANLLLTETKPPLARVQISRRMIT